MDHGPFLLAHPTHLKGKSSSKPVGFENQRRERDHIFAIGHGVEELGG